MFMRSEVYMYVSLKDDITQLFYWLLFVSLEEICTLTSLCACFQLLWENYLIQTTSDHEVVPQFWSPCSHMRRRLTAVLSRETRKIRDTRGECVLWASRVRVYID